MRFLDRLLDWWRYQRRANWDWDEAWVVIPNPWASTTTVAGTGTFTNASPPQTWTGTWRDG